jgi:hypothetical protein
MGREAECSCDWNGATASVKALVEPPDLLLRGGIKQRIPFAEMRKVCADGDWLRFEFGENKVSLKLGSALAAKWVQYLTAAPPTLARKLGITADTVVRIVGKVDDEALLAALAAAQSSSGTGPGDLILARVNTPAELSRALKTTADQLDRGVPIWFIYAKGKGHPLTETDVRSTALATGIVDTKVAAVSPKLTALRFVKRRQTASSR